MEVYMSHTATPLFEEPAEPIDEAHGWVKKKGYICTQCSRHLLTRLSSEEKTLYWCEHCHVMNDKISEHRADIIQDVQTGNQPADDGGCGCCRNA